MNSISELQTLIFENKKKVKENDYIEMMRKLKDLYLLVEKSENKEERLINCKLDLDDELECPCCSNHFSTEDWIYTNDLQFK